MAGDLKEDSGKKKSTFVILSRTTTHLTREILHSSQTRPKQQTSSGASFRNSRKKNVQKACSGYGNRRGYLLLPPYGPGYICEELKDKEQVVGLQTDKPLKRAFMPFGGIKMAEEACKTYGYEPNPKFHKIFTRLS